MENDTKKTLQTFPVMYYLLSSKEYFVKFRVKQYRLQT